METQPKTKTAVGKFLQNVGLPILRGATKLALPGIGGLAIEAATNILQPKGEPKKHSVISMATQAIIAGAILLDLTMNHGANLKAILELVGVISSDVQPAV